MAARRSGRMDILRMRLANQGLARPASERPADAVGWLGAVQAQDWPAARWSLGLRMRRAADADVERALDEGEILRTHVLRPTWHLVLPEDIRWMLALTAPQVRKRMAPYDRRLELDGALLSRSRAIITGALRGHGPLTRAEIKERLAAEGIETDVQRLAHILMDAELEGSICSGPRRGKQLTYTLLEERAPAGVTLAREEALERLCRRYFTSHGPAQLKDFAWWSGLSMADARSALEMNDSRLEEVDISGRSFRFVPGARAPRPPAALLLSIYDEYTIAYRDRSDLAGAGDIERMLTMGAAATAVIVVAGRVVGTWKRRLSARRATVELDPLRRLSRAEREAVEEQVARLGAFLGVDADAAWASGARARPSSAGRKR